MSLRIINAGIQSCIQDWGRFGYQHQGIASAGPADEHAFLWANKLVGNQFAHKQSEQGNCPGHAAQIEISMGVFACQFEAPTMLALCGADAGPTDAGITLNGKVLGNWRSFSVAAGDILQCTYARRGMRRYLAIAGGFQVEPQFGSCATLLREGIGGLRGSALQSGDEIQYPEYQADKLNSWTKQLPPQFIPQYGNQLDIAVMPTYQFHDFSEAERDRFFAETFVVSKDIDRMGFRLQGVALDMNAKQQAKTESIISEGIAYGAIQIPADGQPIILGKDRQTIGGYPKIGCVTRLSMNALAQAQPGTRIRFYQQTVAEAANLLRQRTAFFKK